MEKYAEAAIIAIHGTKLDHGPKLNAIIGAISAGLGAKVTIDLWRQPQTPDSPYIAEAKQGLLQAISEGLVELDTESMPMVNSTQKIFINHYRLTPAGRNYVVSMRKGWKGAIALAKALGEIKGEAGVAAALVASVMTQNQDMLSFPPSMWTDFVEGLKILPSATAASGSLQVGILATKQLFPIKSPS